MGTHNGSYVSQSYPTEIKHKYISIIYYQASSCIRQSKSMQINILKTISVQVIWELTTSKICQFHEISAHYSWWPNRGVEGQSKVTILFGPALMFINVFVKGDQLWQSTKPPLSVKIFVQVYFNCFLYNGKNTHPDILSNVEVLVKM